MNRSNGLLCVLVLLSIWARGAAAQAPTDAGIRAGLHADTGFLANDLLAGRKPGSRGDALTRLYLETRFRALGLAPAAPGGGYQQHFEMSAVATQMPPQWTFATRDGPLRFDRETEYMAFPDVAREQATIDGAEVVFVGYGIQAPEYDWDDFAGRDLSGKVLLMLNNDPDWSEDLFAGERRLYYGRWSYKYESAARQGAVGAIIVHTPSSAGYGWDVVRNSWLGEQFELADAERPRTEINGWLTSTAAAELVAAAGLDLDTLIERARSREFEPVPLGITTSLVLENQMRRVATANVAGVLSGSDTERRNEAIVYTAHHDHLGTRPADGDRVFNGARDNAVAVAQLLAVAARFAADKRPARSVLFLALGAEEQGLLGSKFHARHPSFLPSNMVAAINFELANIWGPTRDLPLIGYGKSELDAYFSRAAEAQNRVVTPERFPDRGFFYRSDQFNFARIGVPAVWVETGVEAEDESAAERRKRIERWEDAHYHQPSDEYDPSWDLRGAVEDALAAYRVGRELAGSAAFPAWRPGDEFEAVRRSSRADVSDSQ